MIFEQIKEQSKNSKFEEEIKAEQEEKKKEAAEKKQRQADFRAKAAMFASQWHNVRNAYYNTLIASVTQTKLCRNWPVVCLYSHFLTSTCIAGARNLQCR